MGLLLSILVFSVGVLEALACVRHIQQGILPAWAPRHVTSSSGRRLLREHWRKSTSLDDGSGGGLGPSGDAGALPNGAPSRRPPGERKGSLDEEQAGRPRPPPLTLDESPHHVRSPDIHWPEPVPHSPAKHIEQTLPSPVAEVPADAPTWPADAAPTPLLQRRRTSTSETLPHEEHGQAEPLRAAASAAPPPSFAREAREPPRNKPAKASSFEEARVQAFAPPPPKAPEVASVNHHAPAPRAALVHSIEVTSSALNSLDDAPAPWPIVNIDTVATSDEEGDVSPTSNLASRRVSFDPVPTVVVIDNEKPITEERERGTILAPSIRITDDLESVLRKELPSVIDDIIQEALVKVNEVLESRQNGPLIGVSLLIENLVSKGDQVLKGPMSSASAEEYKDRFEPTVQSIIELQKDKDVVLSAIPQENKLGRSKEEIGALPNGHPTLLKNEETPSTGLQKSHPRENEAQISNATADQISPSAPAKDGYANTLQFAPAPSEKPNSEIEFGKDVLLDNSKLGNLSASSEPVSQTNVQNSIQDVKKRLGNSEELIPESVSGSENKTTDETGGISNCVAEPPVIPNKTKSAPNLSQTLHDTTNENEIRNEMQGYDGSEERMPETTWKLQSPTAGESLILGDAAVAAAAPVPAESGSIASAPASSAALPPSESRENAAPVPLASASESPVASAAPHIPSDAPESPVAPDSTSESIPLDTVFADQAITNNAPESSSPTEDVSASSTFPSPNVSIALDSPAASAAPEVQIAPAAPSSPVAPAAPAASVAPASPKVPAASVATIAPSVPADPTTLAAVVPPTSPAAPSTPNSPANPAASAVLSAPIPEAPSSVASAVPADSAVVAPASPVALAASVAPTSPAAPVAPAASVAPTSPAAPVAPAASVAPTSPAAPVAPAASVAPTSPAAPVAPAASVAPTSPAAPVAPVASVAPTSPAAPVAPAASVAPTSPVAPAASVAPPSPAPPSPVAPAASPAPAASIAPTSPAAAVAPVASSPVAPAASPAPAASVASTSPAAAAAPVAPSPVAPAASPAPAASVAPTSPAAAAAPVAPSPVAPAASPAPAASVVPTSPAAAAAPVAPSPPFPAVPVPAPGSSKARPASAASQPPAPAPAVGAPLKEEEPSRAPSSSGRPAGGGRAAAPAAPKAPEALAAPAPQPGAFWVSDASSSPAPHAHTPPQPTFTATKKPTPVSQPRPPPKAPTAPWTQKTPSAGSTKQPFSGFQKSLPAESAKTPQSPAFPKATSLSKTPPSPTFVKKQFGAPAPTPVASFPLKQTSSPFGTKVTSSAPPAFYKPAATSTTPAFLTNLTPKASSAFNSRFSNSSPPVSEPIPRPPSPAPAPPVEKREESSSETPSSDLAPRPAPTPAPASSRPTSPPPRDPQEVVRRLAELRRTNPTVATEVLLSILGFKFPGS